jgi:hypothetical protein
MATATYNNFVHHTTPPRIPLYNNANLLRDIFRYLDGGSLEMVSRADAGFAAIIKHDPELGRTRELWLRLKFPGSIDE